MGYKGMYNYSMLRSMHASTNGLQCVTNSTFHRRLGLKSGGALTIAADSSIAHSLWKKRKQIKKERTGEGSPTECVGNT